jgi:hypothetical protein
VTFVASLFYLDKSSLAQEICLMERWEERWDHERQTRLLDVLGGFAERVERDAALVGSVRPIWHYRACQGR